MTHLFDTTTTNDLTDTQKQAAIAACKGAYPNAIIALARLMRDHPELFEEPVDPLLKEARKIAADVLCLLPDEAEQLGKGDDVFDAALAALKRGMELAKPTEPEWIDWHGGECPVPAAAVEVKRRDGKVVSRSDATTLRWDHEGRYYDIVAYRVWP